MCQPLPGPRCASHARKRLQKALSTEDQIRHLVLQDKATEDQLSKAIHERKLAQLEYDLTPTGQRELQQQILTTQDHYQKAQMKERLAQAQTHRATATRCLELHRTAQDKFTEHESLLRRQEDAYMRARTLLIQADQELTEKTRLLETTHTELGKVKQRLKEFYFQQGDVEKAQTPAVWVHEQNASPLHRQWSQLQSQMKRLQTDVEHARRSRGRAYARYQLGSLNLRMTRAEVASDLLGREERSFAHYGQIFINDDGSTNARLLTRIPHTNTEVFARVRKLTDEYAILETGTKVRLSARLAPSYWRFEKPADSATQGPQIFTVQNAS